MSSSFAMPLHGVIPSARSFSLKNVFSQYSKVKTAKAVEQIFRPGKERFRRLAGFERPEKCPVDIF